MSRTLLTTLICPLLFITVGCGKHRHPLSEPARADVCELIRIEEMAAIMGSSIRETKRTTHQSAGLTISQCFYTAVEFNKSINLTVTETSRSSVNARNAKAAWQETFGAYDWDDRKDDAKKKRSAAFQSTGSIQENESVPAKRVDEIGDRAYWIGSRVGGALYVLKDDVFICISVGGPDDEESKINKSKSLAQKVLPRL